MNIQLPPVSNTVFCLSLTDFFLLLANTLAFSAHRSQMKTREAEFERNRTVAFILR